MVGVGAVDETGGLLAEDLLLEMAVQEGVGDVHLVHRPRARHRELEDGANRPGFNNRGEGVGEVDTGALTKAANHPAGLMMVRHRKSHFCGAYGQVRHRKLSGGFTRSAIHRRSEELV